MYKDDDGNLYDLAVRKPDKYMCIARMSDDYMFPASEYVLMPNLTRATEAPTIIKRNGVYHLVGSGSTGWAPNAASYFTTKSLKGHGQKKEIHWKAIIQQTVWIKRKRMAANQLLSFLCVV